MTAIKILSVDDEAPIELLMKQYFRRKIRSGEYEFFFARNGLEALSVLSNTPDIEIILCDIDENIDQIIKELDDLAGFVDHVKALVQSYLVISGTACMKALACIADAVGKLFFDEHMDIFCIRIESQLSGFDVILDREQTCLYGFSILS